MLLQRTWHSISSIVQQEAQQGRRQRHSRKICYIPVCTMSGDKGLGCIQSSGSSRIRGHNKEVASNNQKHPDSSIVTRGKQDEPCLPGLSPTSQQPSPYTRAYGATISGFPASLLRDKAPSNTVSQSLQSFILYK